MFILLLSMDIYGQNRVRTITLNEVINTLSLLSPAAKIEKLNFQNKKLEFENYKKSYLPAIAFNFDPIHFNRSLRLLQQPSDGSYSFIEDYSNNSTMGISVSQKIGFTGGELIIGSNINYLREFSWKKNSFNTNPFYIGYSQPLWGGGKIHRIEKDVEYAKNKVAIKQYYMKLSLIQQQAMELYMNALFSKMEQDLALQNKFNTDTLLQLAHIKLNNGYITNYDLKQIELQSLNSQYTLENAFKTCIEAQQRLAVFLGIEEATVEVPLLDVPLALETNKVMFYVEQNNPLFQQIELQCMEAKQNLLSVKLNNSFSGNISLNYGINQYAETLVNAYRKVNTRQSIVVSFKIPIFQWGINKNRILIAENNYRSSTIEMKRLRSDFENKVKENINIYNHSVNLWQIAEKTYNLSKEQYQMIVQKFFLGKVSVYELTAAQSEQSNAMQHYYTAIKDTYKSYFTLRSMALYDFKENMELEEIMINL